MASRPYFSHRGQDLVAAFEAGREDLPALEALRAELVHRNTPSMRDLSVKVDQALATIKKAVTDQPPVRSSVSRPQQPELPLAPDGFSRPDEQSVSSKPKPSDVSSPIPPMPTRLSTPKSRFAEALVPFVHVALLPECPAAGHFRTSGISRLTSASMQHGSKSSLPRSGRSSKTCAGVAAECER